MANSDYVLEDLLTTIIPLFLVLLSSFIKSTILEGYWKQELQKTFMIYIRIFLMFGHYEV